MLRQCLHIVAPVLISSLQNGQLCFFLGHACISFALSIELGEMTISAIPENDHNTGLSLVSVNQINQQDNLAFMGPWPCSLRILVFNSVCLALEDAR